MEDRPERPSLVLRRLVNGYQVTQAIHVAAVLGIADILALGPRSTADLTELTGVHHEALYRLLRALAGVGVLHEEADSRFALTPVGDCLRSDAPESVEGWAEFVGEEHHWAAWQALEYSVRTGQNAFQHVHGSDPWTLRSRHPELGASFDRAMTSVSSQVAASILAVYDFSRFGIIVDVGGSRGGFLSAILAAYPLMRGVVFDLPHVVAGAGPLLEAAGVADRCEVIAGSFFESVPAGGDVYILKAILHDWDDEQALAILETCRHAMADGTALLIVERDIGPPNEMPDAKLSDLNMLVGTGGRERSVDQFATLLTSAGFDVTSYTPGAAGVGVLEAIAIQDNDAHPVDPESSPAS
jgi:hypothetical protein